MAIQFKDYYETIGVERGASEDDIRKAYRKLARKYHPDVAENKEEGEKKFKELNEAYEVLSDPEKRGKYDALGADWKSGAEFRPPPGGGYGGGAGGFDYGFGPGGEAREYHFDGTGFSDFFEHLFGMRGAGGRGGFRRAPGAGAGAAAYAVKGRDIETDLMVTLEEVYHGSKRTLRLQRPGAPGETPAAQTGRVTIPVGVQEGQLLRLAGLGEPGSGGGPAGDLFLHVRIERHPDFRVRGSDLFYELELAPWDAVLGTAVAIRTFKGTVSLTVPAGVDPGEELRMKGMGLPRGGEGGFGDLHAVVRIVLPGEVSEEERKLWEELRDKSDFSPGKR